MSQFNVQQIGESTVVEFTSPSLMDPIELERIAQELYKLVDEQDHRRIILDFERVQYLSSQAIGILLGMQKRLTALKKSNLVLCGVGARLMELLRITRLDRVLSIKPSQKEAVRSYHHEGAHMADLRIATQFSVFLVNKPGILAQVTRALAQEKVNIVAMTLVDSQEHGVLRFVDEDPAKTRAVLKKLNLPTTETEVVCMELSNRPGALADVAGLLGANHININYAYCTSGAAGGRTSGIFKVADINKAQRMLKDTGAKHRETTARRATGRR